MNNPTNLIITTIFGLFAAVNSAQAITVSNSATFNPVLQVDASSGTTSLNISGLTQAINKVTTTINLTKCDDPISSIGVCIGTGFSYNGEIALRLTSPSGTIVNLINSGTFSGQTPGATAIFTFDDDALTPIGGDSLISGTYNPVGSLAAFNGENGNGNWTLTYQDTVGADPLSINAFSLSVSDPTPVPWETDALPVIGSTVLFGFGLWARNKFAKPLQK
jgi:subtilisin-like proprotein convertase family protein